MTMLAETTGAGNAGKTMESRYWAWERTLEEYQGRRNEIDRIIGVNGGRAIDVAKALKKMFGISGHSLAMPDPGKKNGVRIVGFINFDGKGVAVERYPEDTPSGEREKVQFTWTAVANAMIDQAKSKKEEPQANGTGTALASADAGTMTEAERASAVARYEARIQLYKEQIGVGYIGIGRTLNEAKEAGVVPHGQWEAWVTRTTGLTPRQAQRCMQAATEIRDGSALARLEMSKALMLLGSGLDEEAREEIAGKAAEEGATVKALREEIRQAKAAQEAAEAEGAEAVKALKLKLVQETGAATEIRDALKKAESERADLERQMKAMVSAYQKRMDEAAGDAYRRGLQEKAAGMEQDIRKEFQGKIDFLNSQKRKAEDRVIELQEMLAGARKDGSAQWDKGYRAGKDEAEEIRREIIGQKAREIDTLQEALTASEKELAGALDEAEKQRQAAEMMRRNQDDLLAAAEEAEKRAADAEAELEALRAAGPEGKDPAWKIIKMAADRFRTECEMLPILDAPGVLRGEKQIQPCLDWLETWLQVMRDTLAGAIQSEGAVL